MKNILLMPNKKKDIDFSVSGRVVSILQKNSACVYADRAYETEFSQLGVKCIDINELNLSIDAIIVVGGDGSILDAAVYSIKHNAPILGINLGRLGYLSEIDTNMLDKLNNLFTGEYRINEHMTFDVSICKNGETMITERKAVNDVVISHEKSFGISDFELSDGIGNFLTYRADGIIMSTPIGSTAYSLSAGGPAIDGSLEAICVTPICAHSFFNRSVLFSPQLSVSVKHVSKNDEVLWVNVDGRDSYSLSYGDSVTVTKSRVPFKMIVIESSGMLGVIYKKMNYNFDFGR